MTAPVEMTMDENLREQDMAFLYERPTQGKAGERGDVDVLDKEAVTVLSIGMRGRNIEGAKATVTDSSQVNPFLIRPILLKNRIQHQDQFLVNVYPAFEIGIAFET